MKYRVVYQHPTDGTGEVTRHDGQPLTESAAIDLADDMTQRGSYTSVTVERQAKPGNRWETARSPMTQPIRPPA